MLGPLWPGMVLSHSGPHDAMTSIKLSRVSHLALFGLFSLDGGRGRQQVYNRHSLKAFTLVFCTVVISMPAPRLANSLSLVGDHEMRVFSFNTMGRSWNWKRENPFC